MRQSENNLWWYRSGAIAIVIARVSPVYEVIRFECPHKAVILNWEESDYIYFSFSLSRLFELVLKFIRHPSRVSPRAVFRAPFTGGRVLSICHRDSANLSQIWMWAKNIQLSIDIDITITDGNERTLHVTDRRKVITTWSFFLMKSFPAFCANLHLRNFRGSKTGSRTS